MSDESSGHSSGPSTEIRKQAQVASSENAEPAAQASDGNLVHDIRTPMVAVRGYTKMLLDEKEGPLTALQREYLTIVLENSKKVIQLLNDAERLGRKERP